MLTGVLTVFPEMLGQLSVAQVSVTWGSCLRKCCCQDLVFRGHPQALVDRCPCQSDWLVRLLQSSETCLFGTWSFICSGNLQDGVNLIPRGDNQGVLHQTALCLS
jgi:hypothetical protein